MSKNLDEKSLKNVEYDALINTLRKLPKKNK